MVVIETFWKDKRVLVTGHTGFKGSWISLWLQSLEAHVVGYALAPPTRPSLFIEAAVAENMTSVIADVRDPVQLQRVFTEHKPDIVFHLAAEVGGIGANMKNPGRYFFANMAMSLHLIEHARLRKLGKFVQVGTICAYPKFTPVPFQESELWNGYPEETNAPYGIAKKAAMVMLDAYQRQYGLKSTYVLPVNLYGPGDNFNPDTSHVVTTPPASSFSTI